MTAFLFPVFEWFARNKWAMWTLFAVLALLGAKTWVDVKVATARADERKRQHEQRRVERAEIREAVTERQAHVVKKEQTYADQALEARDAGPVYADADSVPDSVSDVLFRR